MTELHRGTGRGAWRPRHGSRGGRNGAVRGERCRPGDGDPENRCRYDSNWDDPFHQSAGGAEGGSVGRRGQRGQSRGSNQRGMRYGRGGKQHGNRGGRRDSSQMPDFDRGSSLSLTSDDMNEIGSQSSLSSERGNWKERGRVNSRFRGSSTEKLGTGSDRKTVSIPSLLDALYHITGGMELVEQEVHKSENRQKIERSWRGRERGSNRNRYFRRTNGSHGTGIIHSDTNGEYFEHENDDKETRDVIQAGKSLSAKKDRNQGMYYYNKTYLELTDTIVDKSESESESEEPLDKHTVNRRKLLRRRSNGDLKQTSRHSLAENIEVDGVVIGSPGELKENKGLPKNERCDADVHDAFSTLLTKFGGRAQMDELLKHKEFFPTSFFNTEWLKRNKHIFLVFERNGTVEFVSVYRREAKLCFFSNRANGCTNATCQYFHVCDGFVTGTCKAHFHNCARSHNFLENENAALVLKLGLNEFKNKEIARIVRCSVPEVCRKYNKGLAHHDETCPYLHVCDQYPCSQTSSCQLEHRCVSSKHNLWVLNCFRIGHFKESVLENMILGRSKEMVECGAQLYRTAGNSTDRSGDDDYDEMNAEYAFKTLLTKYEGKERWNRLSKHTNSFPKSFFKMSWLLKHKDKFVVFKNSERIEYISVYCRQARVCAYFDSPRGCTNKKCQYFHVCSAFVTGQCLNDDGSCFLSHNFFDQNNAFLLGRKNLLELSHGELLKLVRCSSPEVCQKYNRTESHDAETCTYLHVCDEFPCRKGAFCHLEHTCLSSAHNKRILACFHISHFQESNLSRMILGRKVPVDHSQLQTQEYTDEAAAPSPRTQEISHGAVPKRVTSRVSSVPSQAPTADDVFPTLEFEVPNIVVFDSREAGMGEVPGAISESVLPAKEEVSPIRDGQYLSESVLPAKEEVFPIRDSQYLSESVLPAKEEVSPIRDGQYLCQEHIWNTCSESHCPHYHGYRRVPYQWQIELRASVWYDLPDVVNDWAEKNYCDKRSTINIKTDDLDTAFTNLDTMTARLFVGGQKDGERRVRRLSTRSYCQGQGNLSHLTQWCWYWLDNGNIWEPYEPDKTQYSLEAKYLHGQEEYYFEQGRFHYTLSFTGMKQMNLETKKERRVIRRPMYVSGQEVEEKRITFHPYLVQQIPGEKYTVPKHWTPLDLVQPFELIKLLTGSEMFVKVEKSFHSTLEVGRYKISSIFQVQNPSMWDRHCSHKRSMEHTAEREGLSCRVDERMLYHGTDSEEVVRGICVNGFDHRVCGKNGTVYGKGAYFAVKSSYSNNYTGPTRKRYMFRARVLVGQYTTGASELTRPPCRKGHVLYDSCVDNVHNPNIFVLFDQNQAYPEFLIEYEDRLAPVNVLTQPRVPRVKPVPTQSGAAFSNPQPRVPLVKPVPTQSGAAFSNPQPTSPRQPPPTQQTKDKKCVVM